jgi:hypothetical protein
MLKLEQLELSSQPFKYQIEEYEFMPNRVDIGDKEEYAAMGAFFDAISNSSFIKTVDHLTRGIGASFNCVHCTFPGDLDEYAVEVEMGGKVPDGIEFSFDWGEEVYVDIPTFRYFLTMACESYVKDHPEDKAKIAELLARPQPPLTPPGTNFTK